MPKLVVVVVVVNATAATIVVLPSSSTPFETTPIVPDSTSTSSTSSATCFGSDDWMGDVQLCSSSFHPVTSSSADGNSGNTTDCGGEGRLGSRDAVHKILEAVVLSSSP